MKKVILIFLYCSATLYANPNLHRYMWANYRQFGGNYEQANEWYDTIFSSQKPSVFTNKGYVHLLAEKKDYNRIVELIPKLDSVFQKDPDIQLIFVTALKNTDHVTQADDRLLKLNQTFKLHPEITFHSAETLVRRKELKNAIAVIDDYLNHSARKPNNFIFYFLKSQIYTKLNDFARAQENIKFCLEAHPKFPQGWLLFALIQEQAGRLDKAIEGYTSYLEVAGGNKQIEQHLLGLVLKQKSINQNKQVILLNRSCFEKAVILFERKDYKAALNQINQCISENKEDPKLKLLKVEILTAMQEFDMVIDELSEWSLQSDAPQVWLQALHLLARATKAPRAQIIAAFEKIHHQKPTLLLPILLLSDLYSRMQKYTNALVYHKKALHLATSKELKTRILFQIGLIHYENHEYQYAKQALEAAIDLEAEYPLALNLLAYYYATDGKQISKAASLIERALQKDPHNIHFLDTKAVVLYKQKKYTEALTILKPIAQKHPNDSTILIHLAKTYNKMGNFHDACLIIGDAKKCAINQYEKETTTALLHQWKK